MNRMESSTHKKDNLLCASCHLTSPIFDGLTDEQKTSIRNASCEVLFEKGETIFKQGAPMTHVISITYGLAKLSIESSDTKSIIIKLVKGDEIAGLTDVTSKNIHHFSMTALTNLSACFIKLEVFHDLIKSDSAFAFKVIQQINNYHYHLYDKLSELVNKNVSGRVAGTLIYLCDEIYHNQRFKTALSRQDLADLAATTKESTIRVLKDLKEQKILLCTENTFEILQKERLITIRKFG